MSKSPLINQFDELRNAGYQGRIVLNEKRPEKSHIKLYTYFDNGFRAKIGQNTINVEREIYGKTEVLQIHYEQNTLLDIICAIESYKDVYNNLGHKSLTEYIDERLAFIQKEERSL